MKAAAVTFVRTEEQQEVSLPDAVHQTNTTTDAKTTTGCGNTIVARPQNADYKEAVFRQTFQVWASEDHTRIVVLVVIRV